MKRSLFLLLALAGGCATSPTVTETTREVVLKYIGGDFGTAGPFSKHGKKELNVLSPKDRDEAAALLDRGAEGFLIFQPKMATRVVLVMKGRVVGDFRAVE